MTNREFYQKTFSQVHPSRNLQWEDFQNMRQKSIWPRRLVTLAAVVGILAILSAAAVAADFLGIRSVLLPNRATVGVEDENGVLIPGETEEVDIVSLSGLQDTPESRALTEWQAFLDGYDPDGSILARIGNSPTGFEDHYGCYLVYTREMADKLDEIAAKYGLKLHQQLEIVEPEQWNEAAGPFLMGTNYAGSGYIYEDGTFHYDGGAKLPGCGKIDYQFRRSVRGTLHDVILNVADVTQYESWTYETLSGVPVTLALSPAKGLILADLEDSFVAVNVLAGTETAVDDVFSSGPISKRELESLADLFYFPALTPVKVPDLVSLAPPEADQEAGANADPGLPVEMPEPEEDPLYVRTGIETGAAKTFVWELSKRLANGDREAVADLFVYPCKVTAPHEEFTVNTAEELLEHYDEAIAYEINGLLDDLNDQDLFASDGLVGVGTGCVWFGLVEDGQIGLFTLWNGFSGTGVRPAESEISGG